MRAFRVVVLRREVEGGSEPAPEGTIVNGADEKMLQLMEEKGWARIADYTGFQLIATIKKAVEGLM